MTTQANVKDGDGPAPAPAPATRGRAGEPLTPLELAAWRGMLSTHATMARRLDADLRERHGISLSAYEVLMLVGEAPRRRMRVSELSGATLLSVSGVSRMIDRLVREGLVTKQPCEDDRRGAEVVLTTMGRGRLRAARASHLAGVRSEFLGRFSDEELVDLARAWERIPT